MWYIYGVLSVSKLLWECAYVSVRCAYVSVRCAYVSVQCAYVSVDVKMTLLHLCAQLQITEDTLQQQGRAGVQRLICFHPVPVGFLVFCEVCSDLFNVREVVFSCHCSDSVAC